MSILIPLNISHGILFLRGRILINGHMRLVIILEDFLRDFGNACQNVLQKIENGQLKHKKITKEFIVTTE